MDQILSTTDLVARLREDPVGFVRQGYNRGLNVSRWLEENSPTNQKGELDAFERVLESLDIRTTSDPAAGWWASNAGDAFRPTEPIRRVLLTEFFARQWRKVSFGQTRSGYLSDDGAAGGALRPCVDAGLRRSQQLAPAIPLSELVAITTPISGTLYRSLYLTYNAEQLRMFRVGESANIPIAELATSERTIQLHKYGRGLRASYEALRQISVDRLALHIQWMAVQAEIDKVAAVLAVLVNGDGNANTAATNYNLTALDTDATAGTLTPKAWIAFKLKWANPYFITTALMTEAVALQLALLTFSGNMPYVSYNVGGMVQGLTPINLTSDAIRYGWTSDAPASTIVGFDGRLAVERVTEIGADISEMARNVENQTEIVTMTETEGYAIFDANTVKTLTISA